MSDNGKLEITAKNADDEESLPHGLATGDYIQIDIKDNGHGIADEDLDHIFDPYYSTKERGSQKGMGLGLSVALSIIRKHGGQLGVHSTSQAGTCMRIYLPASTADNN